MGPSTPCSCESPYECTDAKIGPAHGSVLSGQLAKSHHSLHKARALRPTAELFVGPSRG